NEFSPVVANISVSTPSFSNSSLFLISIFPAVIKQAFIFILVLAVTLLYGLTVTIIADGVLYSILSQFCSNITPFEILTPYSSNTFWKLVISLPVEFGSVNNIILPPSLI